MVAQPPQKEGEPEDFHSSGVGHQIAKGMQWPPGELVVAKYQQSHDQCAGTGIGYGPVIGADRLIHQSLGVLVVGEHGLRGPFQPKLPQPVFVAEIEHGHKSRGQRQHQRYAYGKQNQTAPVTFLSNLGAMEQRRGHGFTHIQEKHLLHDCGGSYACRAEKGCAEHAHQRIGRGCGHGEIRQPALTDDSTDHEHENHEHERQQQGGHKRQSEEPAPTGHEDQADDQSPQRPDGRHPLPGYLVELPFVLALAAPTGRTEEACQCFLEVMAGKPDKENEEDQVGTDCLRPFRPGQIRTQGRTKGCFGKLPAEHVKHAEQQAAQQIEHPHGKGYLPCGQEGEPDKGRDEIQFELMEAGEQPKLREITASQNQRGHLRHRWVVEMKPVDEMQESGKDQPDEQIPVAPP